MIKKTLFFGNPASLSLRNKQLLVQLSEEDTKNKSRYEIYNADTKTIPIEDIGIIVLENRQITITNALMAALLENNSAIISCNASQMPTGLLLPLSGNTIQSERFRAQINSSLPLKKQLWQQTIQSKIRNQATLLSQQTTVETHNMFVWANNVKSGDSDNLEARAAAYYWKNIFPAIPNFVRGREEEPPNNLLNYGYAILRAIIARSLVTSGLLPTLGIHHHNRYNAYCLADDIMEPYRPFVDKIVCEIVENRIGYEMLTTDLKKELLKIPVLDVIINGQRSPLMVAATTTTASLAKCFAGESRKIVYPEMPS